MSYDELGDFSGQYKFVEGLDVGRLRGGFIESKEIVIAGGTQGVIRSQDFVTGASGSGWAIKGDGSAEFNNVVVRGILAAGVGSDVDWSYISNVTIDSADITSLTFDKITAGSNTATLTLGSGGKLRTAASGERFELTGGANAGDLTWYDAAESTVGYIGVGTSNHMWLNASGNQLLQFGSFIKLNADTGGSVQLGVNSVYGLIHSASGTYIGTATIGNTLDLNTYGPSITGQLKAASGSAGTPTFTFSGDSDTGIYLYGVNEIGFAAQGLYRMRLGTGGLNVSGQVAATGTLSGNACNVGTGTVTAGAVTASGLISTTNYLRATGTGSTSNCQIQLGAATTGLYNSGGTIAFVSGGTSVGVFGTGYFGPSSDNTRGCGASGARWTAVWAVNGTIQTSDLKKKNVLEDSDVPGLSFVRKLKPIKYTWKEGWDQEHVHWGFGAQDVQKLVGNEGPLRADDPDNLGINYAEMIPALVVAIQELNAKLENHVCGSAE